jgi:drug/metabolite transporter (DMT)-like permease
MGGIQARRVPALSVVLWSEMASTGLLVAVLVVLGEQPPGGAMAWGALGGALGAIALTAFYRGLAVGLMSIVAPISAAGAAIPVVAGLLGGEAPTAVEWPGILLAVAGVVLVSLPGDDGVQPQGDRALALRLAVAAALGFGLFFVIVDAGTRATDASPLWVIGGVRVGSLLTLGAVGVARPAMAALPRGRMGPVAVLGILDTTATSLFAFAATRASIGVVSVLASQYPVVTMALARGLLRERLTPVQRMGVGLALGGVGLLAAG